MGIPEHIAEILVIDEHECRETQKALFSVGYGWDHGKNNKGRCVVQHLCGDTGKRTTGIGLWEDFSLSWTDHPSPEGPILILASVFIKRPCDTLRFYHIPHKPIFERTRRFMSRNLIIERR